MQKNTNLCYSKIYLRNRLRLHQAQTEAESKQISHQISLIAEIINNSKVYQISNVSEGKTREQLFNLGFSISQIQKYFEYKSCDNQNSYMRWFLKSYLIINGKKIRTIKDLVDTLELNKVRHAC